MFPDLNIGYIFGYTSDVDTEGIQITFLKGLVRIVFRYEDIEIARVTTYNGGRISWNAIRWGKCPKGTKTLEIILKRGIFRRHLIVFDNLGDIISKLENHIEVAR